MLDLNNFNDFIPNEAQESSNLESIIHPQNLQSNENIFINNNNIPQIDEEEQKRLEERQKESETRKEKINQKIEKEEKLRNEIRKKAAEYLLEFEQQRQEKIVQKRKELEEKEKNININNNTDNNSDMWHKVSGNIDMKESEYKGSKDVQRMREAMMNRQNDPNSEPIKNFFG